LNSLVKISLASGAFLFVFNSFLVLTDDSSGIYVFADILPGFIYGTMLSLTHPAAPIRKVLFILLSGGLFMAVAWMAFSSDLSQRSLLASLPMASIFGAIVLYLLYYYLINKDLSFDKGLWLMLVCGLVSSVPMLIGAVMISRISTTRSKAGVICMLSVFIIWQTLFGWNLSIVNKEPVITEPEE
jgi:hypothetical protein